MVKKFKTTYGTSERNSKKYIYNQIYNDFIKKEKKELSFSSNIALYPNSSIKHYVQDFQKIPFLS